MPTRFFYRDRTLLAGAIVLPIGYSSVEHSKLVNPEKYFVEVEEGCNITKIEYEFTDENKERRLRRLRGRPRPRCADTYTYSFSTMTNPPMYYQDKHIMKKWCADADEIKESTLRMGNITKCWRFVSPNPLSKLTEEERKEVIKEYDCYNKDCAKVIDPDGYYTRLQAFTSLLV